MEFLMGGLHFFMLMQHYCNITEEYKLELPLKELHSEKRLEGNIILKRGNIYIYIYENIQYIYIYIYIRKLATNVSKTRSLQSPSDDLSLGVT